MVRYVSGFQGIACFDDEVGMAEAGTFPNTAHDEGHARTVSGTYLGSALRYLVTPRAFTGLWGCVGCRSLPSGS